MNNPTRCTTHHYACGCREYKFRRMEEDFKTLLDIGEDLMPDLIGGLSVKQEPVYEKAKELFYKIRYQYEKD